MSQKTTELKERRSWIEIGREYERKRIKEIINKYLEEQEGGGFEEAIGVYLEELISKINSPQINVVGKPMIPSAPNTSGNVTPVTADARKGREARNTTQELHKVRLELMAEAKRKGMSYEDYVKWREVKEE